MDRSSAFSLFLCNLLVKTPGVLERRRSTDSKHREKMGKTCEPYASLLLGQGMVTVQKERREKRNND